MYALSLIPLVKDVQPTCNQVWYADDASGCDKLKRLFTWYQLLCEKGPHYGYFVQPSKCILVVKPHQLEYARELFQHTGVQITTSGSKDEGSDGVNQGAKHLGAAVGSDAFREIFINNKLKEWTHSSEILSQIAATEPHAAYAVFTHCLQARWTFICRSMHGLSVLLQPLEQAIRDVFLPALLRKNLSNYEREMVSLPIRLGGLGIFDPTKESTTSHKNSLFLSEPLVHLVIRQTGVLDPHELQDEIKNLRAQIELDTDHAAGLKWTNLHNRGNSSTKKCLEIARQKGASSWVSAVPTHDNETVLNKGEFVDAMYIRYGWNISNLPTNCVCGSGFGVQHALDCAIGGYRTIQHNEVRDLFATMMKEAGLKAVEVEPLLQPLSGENFERKSANSEEEARSDIKCTNLWKKMRTAWFDVKIVSPYSNSYKHLSTKQLYRQAEQAKMREYGERIRNVEHGDFNPLVFTTAGGMAPQSHLVVKRLAQFIAERKELSKSVVSGWLRCRLSFALLRTTLLCLRGTRAKRRVDLNNIELAVSTSQIVY
jgi:hypothetical protein